MGGGGVWYEAFRRTSALHAERENVADNKDLGEPLGRDYGVRGGVEPDGEAAEDHVDGGGEEGGAQEEED